MRKSKLLFNQKVATYELPALVEKERGGFWASCPIWKDCYAQGDTLEEALSEINAVALGLIELCEEEGLPIPLKRKTPFERIKKEAKFIMPLYVTR